jgi:hypothetical protein
MHPQRARAVQILAPFVFPRIDQPFCVKPFDKGENPFFNRAVAFTSAS